MSHSWFEHSPVKELKICLPWLCNPLFPEGKCYLYVIPVMEIHSIVSYFTTQKINQMLYDIMQGKSATDASRSCMLGVIENNFHVEN